MACFVVPAVEAAVVTVAEKALEKKTGETAHEAACPGFARKVKWLRNMLLGGSVLLAFDHLWHGEVTPWFPFLTAMGTPADRAEMLAEMATVGVTMALIVTVVWLGMVLVTGHMEKRALATRSPEAR